MTTTISGGDPLVSSRPLAARGERAPISGEGDAGAVSWPAIFAGAAGAAALSLILLVLGMGLGFASMSPWASQGLSATTVGAGTIVWILFVALVASGTGGYLAGRLRTKWVETHTDEVYFRDTAHGFLAWAVATLATAGLLTSAIGSIVGTGVDAAGAALGATGTVAATAVGGAGAVAAQAKPDGGPAGLGYFTDSLFRPGAAASAASSTSTVASTTGPGNEASASEAGRILGRSLAGGALPPEDARYLGQLVSQRTGLAAPDAEKRVADTFAKAQQSLRDAEAKAKDAADKARKAAAYAALWMFVSLLLGAFTASLMATFGGRQRDF